MAKHLVVLVCLTLLFIIDVSCQLRAGAAKVDGTQIGVPLAGYNHGQRRVPDWPIPIFTEYTTFMTPSLGAINPTWTKALVIDTGDTQFAFITLDGIGSDSSVNKLAYQKAVNMGFTVPESNCLFSGSHSHSGPGAVSPETLWAMAPATDLLVPKAQDFLAAATAKAMIQAQANLQPAKMDIGIGYLVNVTVNRRSGISPYVNRNSIDPNLGVIRVDTAAGQPLATVWNFAVHGVCYGPENLYFSSDIMGGACDWIEKDIGGIALYVNADAGDIDPAPGMCNNAPNFYGSPIIANAVKNVSQLLHPSSNVDLQVFSQEIEFGETNLNFTLQRFQNCSTGGTLDICTICSIIMCDINAHMPSSWVETKPRFTAARFDINNVSTVVVSLPGEPLLELGWWVRNDTKDLGFDQTILAGYSNSHMGYFAPPDEYDIGGYESQLTFWGINTAQMVRDGCKTVASQVVKRSK